MPDRILGGRYIIQDKIGTGGMAVVYRGLDNRLGRQVAIKTMLPQYAADPSFAARFKQEAQAAAALQSPYIVSVYDWGKDNDTYFIAMEYLRGTDLKSGVRKHGALDSKKVAQIGSQIAQALSVAHKHDIIHRDIKPQNIMVQPDGNIKVMDFGIAHAKNSHLTTDNSVLGTAHYVSPEQTQGKPLGPTTDIYSLGIVMYEAATGVVPFDGDDAITVALKQVNEQPIPPSQRNPRVDAALEQIILRCMQKDPAMRYQHAEDVFAALREYLAGRMPQQVAPAGATLPVMSATPLASPVSSPNKTKTLPRIANANISSPRKPLTSATQHAQLAAQQERKSRKAKTIAAVIVGILAAIGVAVALVTLLGQTADEKPVPNLINLTQQEALFAIENSGYFQKGTRKEEYSDTVEKGRVLDQDPNAGRMAKKGTPINFSVSKGAAPAADVVVPDLKGKSPSEADALLAKAGLKSQAGDSINSTDVEIGKIAAQSPAPNAQAKAGDTVTYQLSKGPEEVDVPSQVGKTESAARSALEGLELKVATKQAESDKPEGTVLKQDVVGKSTKGSTITLTIAKKAEQQDLTQYVQPGDDAQSAISKLEGAGFTVNVRHKTDSNAAKGTVISAPSKARAGGTVTITVSDGAQAQSSDTQQSQ